MSRRYQVLLPKKFNDGIPVPSDLYERAIDQIVDKFGGVSIHIDGIRGHWKNLSEKICKEDMLSLFVDVPDSRHNAAILQWFYSHKKEWELLFKQDVIYITSQPVLVLN